MAELPAFNSFMAEKEEQAVLVNVFFPPIKKGKDEEFRTWFDWSNESTPDIKDLSAAGY